MTPLLRWISNLIPEKILDEDARIRKVLIVDVNFSGDMLLDSVAWKAISDNLSIKADALSYHSSRDILKMNDCVGNIFTVSKSWFSQFWMAYKLWFNDYDLVIHLNTSLKWNFFIFLMGAKYNLGYDYNHRGCFLNMRIPLNHRTHHGEYRLDEVCDLFYRSQFSWNIGTRKMIFRTREVSSPVIVFCTTTRNTQELRMWDKFPQLADALIEKFQASIVFTGMESEKEYVEGLISRVVNNDDCYFTLTSINDLGKLIRSADLVVSVNSIVMHIAVAMETPLVAIIGGSPSRTVLPKTSNIIKFVEDPNLSSGSNESALNTITVEQVMDKIDELFLIPK